jgi:hypothetical protein
MDRKEYLRALRSVVASTSVLDYNTVIDYQLDVLVNKFDNATDTSELLRIQGARRALVALKRELAANPADVNKEIYNG